MMDGQIVKSGDKSLALGTRRAWLRLGHTRLSAANRSSLILPYGFYFLPIMAAPKADIGIDRSAGDFSYPEAHTFDAGTGLTPQTIDYIADVKGEPDWIREFRHKALAVFNKKAMPTHWATKDLENIVFDNIRYYLSRGTKPSRSWDDVPEDMKKHLRASGHPRAGTQVPRWRRGAVRQRGGLFQHQEPLWASRASSSSAAPRA